MQVRHKIYITGIVQGVGFRPTVFKLAQQFSLTGTVNNNSQGVTIEVQGDENRVDKFKNCLRNNPPPVARIDSFQVHHLKPIIEKDFNIIHSQESGQKNVLISADLATCPQCLNDISDPSNRRYKYPFTNCTNCGPRFSIIKDRPYDRPLTSMSSFEFCSECQHEYTDPSSRRFHAQPNACASCGPQISLLSPSKTPLQDAITMLKAGKTLAIKGVGGFNLCVDASNTDAVKKLREKKRRPTKSLALMVSTIEHARKLCHISPLEEQYLCSSAAPITIVRKNGEEFNHISPDNNYLGIILPYTPLHSLLMEHFDTLAFTSANLAGEPIAITDSEVQTMYDNRFIDEALTHNREIIHRSDDSIIQVVGDHVQFIRRSRGFVPLPLLSPIKSNKTFLSLGANMKNTFALSKDNHIFLSQHIGELLDYRNLQYQQSEIEKYKNLLELTPDQIICDMHPQYETYHPEYLKVFHHHAHFLTVLAEHDLLNQEVIGVIADGTGYGEDHSIWGFEFLSNTNGSKNFKRLASLEAFPLIGSEKAISEIDRIGIYLDPAAPHFNAQRVQIIKKLQQQNMNTIMTSSLGRLFDGIASLLNIVQYAEYEAQGAILLQQAAENFQGRTSPYKCSIQKKERLVIQITPLVSQIKQDLQKKLSREEMAYKFHLWVVEAIIMVTKELGITKIACSGGCFQNRLLTELLQQKIKTTDITLYLNNEVPPNDAGISFGQIIYAQLQGVSPCV